MSLAVTMISLCYVSLVRWPAFLTHQNALYWMLAMDVMPLRAARLAE